MPRLELHKREVFEPPATGQPPQPIDTGIGAGMVQAGLSASNTFARATQLSVLFSEQERKLKDYIAGEELQHALSQNIRDKYSSMYDRMRQVGTEGGNWEEQEKEIEKNAGEQLRPFLGRPAVYAAGLAAKNKIIEGEHQWFEEKRRKQFVGESASRIKAMADENRIEAIRMLRGGDQTSFYKYRERIFELLNNQLVFTPDDIRSLTQEYDQTLHRGVAAMLANEDPKRFLNMRNEGFFDRLPGPVVSDFSNMADLAMRRERAEKKGEEEAVLAAQERHRRDVANDFYVRISRRDPGLRQEIEDNSKLLGDYYKPVRDYYDHIQEHDETIRDNPSALIDVYDKWLSDPNSKKLIPLVMRYALDGYISTPTLRSFVEAIAGQQRAVETKADQDRQNDVSRGAAHLRALFLPPPGIMGRITSGTLGLAQAGALKMYYELTVKDKRTDVYKLAEQALGAFYDVIKPEIEDTFRSATQAFPMKSIDEARNAFNRGDISRDRFNAFVWLKKLEERLHGQGQGGQ